jgi:hypothetical protein
MLDRRISYPVTTQKWIPGTRESYNGSAETSLRIRSPFSITTILMVGARVRDGGEAPSDVQLACKSHAQRIGMSFQNELIIAVGTLFNPVARVEAVQAMSESPPDTADAVLLAAFSENGWLPGGE